MAVTGRHLRPSAVSFLAVLLAACSAPSPSQKPISSPSPVAARVCVAVAGAVTDVATEPNWRQFAHYRTWTTPDGCILRIDVLGDRPGPEHCGWEAARVIVTGIPVGARYSTDRNAANYVRDPDDVFGDPATASAFDADAQLPEHAVDTGFRQKGTALWVDPADGSAIYLVTGTTIERWPLDPQPAGCM